MSAAVDTLSAIAEYGGDPLDMPFWDACREGKFLLHRCNICSRHYWPASRCVAHGAREMQWVAASGRGTLYTYTVLHHAYTPAMKDKVPYVVAVVQLDEGPFFHSNLVDTPLDQVKVGMRLQVTMAPHESGLVVPVFKQAPSPGPSAAG